MSNLRISLVQERPDQPFYSGSTIAGNVLLDVNEPKSFKYASIKFSGRSYVHWEERRRESSGNERRTESSGNERRTVVHKYTSEQPCANEDAMLWTSQQSPDGKLGVAEYNWPFTFTIPSLAPSSFEGTVGNIRYVLEARVGTGLLKFDHIVEARIPVQQLVSITDPRLLLPERLEAQKTLGCCCCATGPITMNVSVPKTGFCLNDTFTLHISVENASSRQVTASASICQLVLYKARGHQRSSKKTLASYESDPIEGRASREWNPTIQIPVTELIHEGSCDNIEVQYTLVVATEIPQALDISRSIPIKLANCSVQQQGGQNLAPPSTGPGYPPPGTTYPPPGPVAPYPPQPTQFGAPQPMPQMGHGLPPTGPQPTGWPYNPNTAPPPPGVIQPTSNGKLSPASSESSVHSDTARLL